MLGTRTIPDFKCVLILEYLHRPDLLNIPNLKIKNAPKFETWVFRLGMFDLYYSLLLDSKGLGPH
jgi:hypothetical protein